MARSISGGHLSIIINYKYDKAQTLQCASVVILLITAEATGFRVRVVDARLAYVESDRPLSGGSSWHILHVNLIYHPKNF